jgi:D-glycero-D-manno-heptose 1,7-bisphosphate phosphatase
MLKIRKAVFLDRDGVINRAILRDGKPYPPVDLTKLEILPGVERAIKTLHESKWLLIVVTNQPDVARGLIPLANVEEINRYLMEYLPIDEIRTCIHDSGDGCGCRKPSPGALLEAASTHCIDLAASFMVGDRWRDIEAGLRAGCQTIFIDYGYNEKQPEKFNYRVQSLAEAADIILGNPSEKVRRFENKNIC